MLPPDTPSLLQDAWRDLQRGAVDLPTLDRRLHGELRAVGVGNAFVVDSFVIWLDLRERVASVRANLARVEPLGLAIAPVVVDAYEDAAMGLLIARYAAVAGEGLERFGDGTTPIPDASRARFLDEVRALFDAGLHHPYLVRGVAHWWCSDRTTTLVVGAWDALEPTPPDDPDAALWRVERGFLLR